MIYKVFFLFFSLFIGFQAVSQQSAYVQYDTRDGLAQSQVRAIMQDSQGYLWFGTVGGLSRFDGYDFLNFSTEDGLPANQINCLLQGRNSLWIGSTGNLCKRTGTGFITIPLPDKYSRSKIFDMAEDGKGNLWVALAGEGLLKYDGNSFAVFDESNGLPNNYLRAIALAPDGVLWVGTREGIALIENGKVKKLPYPDLAYPSISDILFTKDGRVVICTFGWGVFTVDDERVEQFTVQSGLQSDHIRCVTELANGELWFGAKEGLSKLKAGHFSVFKEEQGLQYSNVKTLGEDREGNLWIGTDGKGILLQAGRSFTSYNRTDGLHSDLAMDICETDTGSLVFASYDNGLAVLADTGFVRYKYNDQLPSRTVWVMDSDDKGNLWAGTSQGLFCENRGNIKVVNTESGLPGERITAILRDGNTLWVGADEGFAKLNIQGEIINVFNDSTGFAGNRIRSIEKLGEDVWLGAEGKLYKYDGSGFTGIAIDPKEEKPIYCLKGDDYQNLWIGTSNGLYNLNTQTDDLVLVEFGSGFASRNINFLTNLRDSTLLIGTNNGLFRLQLSSFYEDGTIKSKHYTNYEGLKSGETNQNAVYFNGGSVWFGTTSGAVKFDPYRDSFNTNVAPALHISGVQLFLQDVNWNKRADSVSLATGLPVEPVLNYNENYLTFYYSGSYFTNPDKVMYRYRLAGADDKWLGPTDSRSVTYAYLPHGDYVFELESYSIDEPDLISATSFGFHITPPFYLTPWFFVLVGLAVLGIVYMIFRARVRKEQEKSATLKLQFQSRLMTLESQTLNSSMNRHFIFNALNSIQYYINMQDRKSANQYLTSFAKLIRKNLDSSQQNETSLKDELERIELYLSLEQMRFQGRFDYKINISVDINTENVEIPAMMLQPFLENSIWHGILPTEKHGQLVVDISAQDQDVQIVITDNGIGVDTSMRNKNGSDNGHISKGMEITQNRIQLYRKMTGLNYRVDGPEEMKNDTDEILGTRVSIKLPMASQTLAT